MSDPGLDPHRWQRVKQLVADAAGRTPADRTVFLAAECAGDEALQREVEALLAAHDQAGDVFDRRPPIFAELADTAFPLAAAGGQFATGHRLGHYEIVEAIGAGGMGEVYRARDTRLHRDVALKILPAALVADPSRRERFIHEARAASAVEHPHIAVIHEIGEAGGVTYIAMELVRGEPLGRVIARGALAPPRALDLGIEIVEALARAHETGLIHRDLKPANVMLTEDDHVKIIDFGLAKLVRELGGEAGAAGSDLTATGVVLGTPSYLSPEQAQAANVDHRSDLFSFGIMLHEMLTGRAPFRGNTPIDTMHAILHDQPPPLPSSVGPAVGDLQRILEKCLAKQPDDRYQRARDLLVDLRAARRRLESAEMAPSKVWRLAPFALVGAAIAAILVWLVWSGGSSAGVSSQWSFSQVTDAPGQELYPSLSPDGRSLVYASQAAGNWDIYLQRVGGTTAVNLTKDSEADDTQPAFSPDGERIAFRSERDGGGLYVMGATGESATRLSDRGFHPSWSPEGTEIAASTIGFTNPETLQSRNSQLIVVEVATGKTRVITAAEDVHQPHWSPHGYRIAYWGRPGEAGQRDLWTVAASGGAAAPVTNDAALDWNPVWSPDGRSLFFSSNRGGSMNLWRVPVDEASGTVLGQPQPVTTPSPYSGYVSISRDGLRIAYAQLSSAENLFKIGFDPSREATVGQPTAITHGTRSILFPDLSPNGEWVVARQGEAPQDVIVVRTDGSGLRKLTDDPQTDRDPSWAPDGKTIAFTSDRSGSFQIWTINADGSGLRRLTDADITMRGPAIWSPDGSRMAVPTPARPRMSARVLVFDVQKPSSEQTPEVVQFFLPDAEGFSPYSWSADGRQLALTAFGPDPSAGTYIYDFETHQVQKVSHLGEPQARAHWLSDNRRLLISYQGSLYLIDPLAVKIREVMSVWPDAIAGHSLSRDDRLIVYGLRSRRADIWLASAENRPTERQR